MKRFTIIITFITVITIIFNPIKVNAQTAADWPMAGNNPQRTSWSSAQGPKGVLSADWIKPIEPYISKRVQIIAAENKIFLSTAKGLYAFDAANGNQLWVYPTSMPLGHSPAYSNGVLYVGGFDRKVHAINAANGTGKWTFTADGGFNTTPLVVNNTVYIGSRDGYMYAIYADGIPQQGQLKWKFDTGVPIKNVLRAPITTSAAYHAGDNRIYFGADNMYAYAVDANTGQLEPNWLLIKLPGLAMNSWWPVVSGNYVYFTVAPSYVGKMMGAQKDAFYKAPTPAPTNMPTPTPQPKGIPLGTVSNPGNTHAYMDVTQKPDWTEMTITDYMETYPGRRSVVVLNRSNGTEKTYDFDNDGKQEFAPFLWAGMAASLTKHPLAIDNNGIVYTRNGVFTDGAIPGGTVAGWQPDSKFIQFAGSSEIGGFGDYPTDEPGALAGGGSMLYHTHCCARVITSFEISVPNLFPPPAVVNAGATNSRQWRAQNWQSTVDFQYDTEMNKFFLYPLNTGNTKDEYMAWQHSDTNPPIPYNGRVYVHRSNALIALSPSGAQQIKIKASSPILPKKNERQDSVLKDQLHSEVQKIIDAGHLRSGVFTIGLQDPDLEAVETDFMDIYHNISETYIILLRALPKLSSTMQTQLRNYLQSEWAKYPATNSMHLGFSEGSPRESHLLPENKNGFTTKKTGTTPLNYYAAWKYAVEFGNAQTIYNSLQPIMTKHPPESTTPLLNNDVFDNKPQKLNEYIAGYKGYLELKKLATGQTDSAVQSTLNTLLALKVSQLKTYPPTSTTSTNYKYYYLSPIATNFMYMTPELADHLRINALAKVSSVVSDYESKFPLWFVAKGTEMLGEGTMQPPQYYHGLFQAKAKILKQSYTEVESYLDAPSYAVGDLYYIDNLVAAIEASGNITPPSGTNPSPTPASLLGDINGDKTVNAQDFVLLSNAFGTNNSVADLDSNGIVNIQDFTILSNNFGKSV